MDDRNRNRDEDLADRGRKNKAKGSFKEFEGKARAKIADAAGDESEQLKGKAKEAAGKVQKNVGKAEERISDDDEL